MNPPGQHDAQAPPIQADRLNVSYNGDPALQDVSFSVAAGERVAVVGPNGAGKTTLFKVLAGILQPASGSLAIHGHRPGRHVCVGYVPQRAALNLDFPVSVAEVVMLGRIRDIGLLRWPGRSDWAKVEAALARVGMLDYRSRPIGALSAGQQQRVFLAQTVAQQAEIVLLDEPLTGLDLPSQEIIFEILDDLRNQPVTVLVAIHDLSLASALFDTVLLLNRRLIAAGTPQATLTPDNLLAAYGGHLHVLADGRLLVDTHHEGRQ
jgi:manganese/iron transport system ATP-binding protein